MGGAGLGVTLGLWGSRLGELHMDTRAGKCSAQERMCVLVLGHGWASVVSGGFSPSTLGGGEWGCDPWPLPVHPFLCPQEEFGYNAETQKLLCKNGETLLGAVNFFVSSINTLVNKTMEDTLMTVKQYETARWDRDLGGLRGPGEGWRQVTDAEDSMQAGV